MTEINGEKFKRVSENVVIRETYQEDGFENSVIAVHEPTGVVVWGKDTDDAVENLENDVRKLKSEENDIYIGNEIVMSDDIIGGKPRIKGTGLSVINLLDIYEQTESKIETAGTVSGICTIESIEAAVEWSEEESETVSQLRAEQDEFDKWVEETWNNESFGYSKPDDVDPTWEEYKEQCSIDFEFL